MEIRTRTAKAVDTYYSLKQGEERKLNALKATREPNHLSLGRFQELLEKTDDDKLTKHNLEFMQAFAEYHFAMQKRKQGEAKMNRMLIEDIYDGKEFKIREGKIQDRIRAMMVEEAEANSLTLVVSGWLGEVFKKIEKIKGENK